jgi:hypothetical protein
MSAAREWAKRHDVVLAVYGAWLTVLTVFSLVGWPWEW